MSATVTAGRTVAGPSHDPRQLSVVELQHGFHGLLTSLRGGPPDGSLDDGSIDAARTNRVRARLGGIPTEWVAVVAAHSGAGASTVALAIADAMDADGNDVHLVDAAEPSRSGLIAAPRSELGLDQTKAWRRGRRERVTIDRRADGTSDNWPAPAGAAAECTIVDVGLPPIDDLATIARDARCVLVTRVTVPGVRITEQALETLANDRIVIAAVGPARWPGAVATSVGPRLRQLRNEGRVVTIPFDQRLAIEGLTQAPMPKRIATAGRELAELLTTFRTESAARLEPKGIR